MKIRYLTLVVGLFLINISIVLSQIPVLNSGFLLDKLRLNGSTNGIQTVLYANINGDPFLYKDFKKGILSVDGAGKYDVLLRYDIFSNQMHLLVQNEIYAIIHPEKVNLIEIDSLKIIYSRYVKSIGDKTSSDAGYFIVKADGRCKLLVKKNIRLQDAEPEKPFQDAKPPKFILKEDTYYLKLKDQSAVKIKNEKELLAFLADQNQALVIFIKSNKLDIKNIKDLAKVVHYYNGL